MVSYSPSCPRYAFRAIAEFKSERNFGKPLPVKLSQQRVEFMPETRDRIEKIAEIKARSGESHTFIPIGNLSILRSQFDSIEEKTYHRIKYFPIGLVTVIEVFFRLFIKELIDHGPPFVDNAGALTKQLKFDFPLIQAIYGKQVTIGELISHAIPINNMTNIASNISQLLNDDYLKNLESVYDRWDVEVHRKPKKPIIDDISTMCRNVQRLFEVRHIICHELPNDPVVSADEVDEFFRAAESLLRASQLLLWSLLEPDAPLTQSEMNVRAEKDYADLEDRLEKTIARLIGVLDGERKKEFTKTQSCWLAYLQKESEFVANEFKGGSIRPVIYYSKAQELVEDRIDSLEQYIESVVREC